MRKPARFEVEWAETARDDLEAIVQFVADDDIDNALAVLERLESAAATLTSMPLRGRRVPELAALGIQDYREIIVRPWRIVYRLIGKKVRVAGVLDSRRNLEDLLLERLIR